MPTPERVAELANDMDATFRGLDAIDAEDAAEAAKEAARAAAGVPAENGADPDDDTAGGAEPVEPEHDDF